MNAGATPKFTASASESISSPIREVALRMRAMRPSSASRMAATARNAIASVGRLSNAILTEVSPRQMAATVMALGRMRRLTTDGLTRGLDHGSSANTVSPASDRWPVLTSDVGTRRQVGVQPRPVPDQPVGVADRQLVADLRFAHDAARHQAGDLYRDHLDAVGGADHHAVAFVVLTGGFQLGRVEQPGAMVDGDHLASDRRPLHVCIENRKEDADARQRRCGQAEFGRRRTRPR